MNNVLVSVVIATYNSEKYIYEAIQSILEQTYCTLELIIINDGSTDKTEDIIQKYREKDNRIVFQSIQKSGISKARNFGVEIAKGEYIAIMDADDISIKERIEEQLKYLVENNLDFCGSWIKTIGSTKASIWKYPTDMLDIKYCMLLDTAFAHPSVFIKSNLLKKYKYNENYVAAIDYDLWTRLLVDGYHGSNIKKFLLLYRIHPTQTIKVEKTHKDKNFNIANKYYIASIHLDLPISKDNTIELMHRKSVFNEKTIDEFMRLEKFILETCIDKVILFEYFLNFYKKHIYLGYPILLHIIKLKFKYKIPVRPPLMIEWFILISFSQNSKVYEYAKKLYMIFK